MMILRKIVINEKYENQRLDKIISDIDINITRTMAKKLIENGNILVNNNKQKPSYITNINDIILIEEPKAIETNLKAQDIPVPIIYEDNDIIVVNKPKGMVVHPANGNPDGTLVNAVLNICKGSLSGIGGEIRPGIVHRLDKDTSGIIVIAKNDLAHVNMSKQIQDRKVIKKYIALVRGIISENEATIDMPIGRSNKDRKKMAVTKNGKQAITHFNVIKRFNNYTLLDIKIDTGRTHQIRVHLAEIGHPVIGDEVYSNGKNEFGIKGQMLHARSLEFNHPITNKKLYLEADIPEYFKNVLKELEENEFTGKEE